jgi:hypothetical protein
MPLHNITNMYFYNRIIRNYLRTAPSLSKRCTIRAILWASSRPLCSLPCASEKKNSKLEIKPVRYVKAGIHCKNLGPYPLFSQVLGIFDARL